MDFTDELSPQDKCLVYQEMIRRLYDFNEATAMRIPPETFIDIFETEKKIYSSITTKDHEYIMTVSVKKIPIEKSKADSPG